MATKNDLLQAGIPIIKTPGFRPWVHKVMPGVYDDTLSYYELLSKVVGYLNQMNDQQNEIIDWLETVVGEQNKDIEMLKKLFISFRGDMVREFEQFKKDVTDSLLGEKVGEILSKWYDDGKLAEIINKEVFDMKADKKDFDELKIVVESNKKILENQKNIVINALDYGVKDTESDNTVSLQKAIGVAKTQGGGIVYIPNDGKNIKFEIGEIVVPSNVTVMGNGTVLEIVASDGAKNLFKTDPLTKTTNVHFKGLNIISHNVKTRYNKRDGLGSNITGIQLSNFEKSTVIDCYFDSLEFAVKSDTYGKWLYLENLVVVKTYEPFYFGSTKRIKGNNIETDRTGMTSSLDHHYYINNGTSHVSIENVTMHGGNGYTIDVKDDSKENPSVNVVFENVTCEATGGIVIAEQKSQVTIRNVRATIDDTLSSANAFASNEDGNVRCESFHITGGNSLISALTSLGGRISLVNGTVGKMKSQMTVANELGKAFVESVLFLDATGDEGIVLFNSSGRSVKELTFRDCHFILVSPKKNDLFSHRLNTTNYYNCVFDIRTTDLQSSITFSYEGAKVNVSGCSFVGNFTNVEWVNTPAKPVIVNCSNLNDGSIINTRKSVKSMFGEDSPETVVSAPVGSTYQDFKNGVFYIKKTGTGNTGWEAK